MANRVTTPTVRPEALVEALVTELRAEACVAAYAGRHEGVSAEQHVAWRAADALRAAQAETAALREILQRAKWIGQQTTADEFSARAVYESREQAWEAYRALVDLRDGPDQAAVLGEAEQAPDPSQRIQILEEALRPFGAFAEVFDHMGGNYPKSGDYIEANSRQTGPRVLTVEDFKAARAALRPDPSLETKESRDG